MPPQVATVPSVVPTTDVDHEKRITAVETELKTLVPTLATRTDIAHLQTQLAQSETKTAEGQSSQLRWFVGWATTIGIVLVAATYFIATHVKA